MLAYRDGLTANTTTMVLSPDSAFFRFFDQFAPIPAAEQPELVLPPVEVPEVEVPDDRPAGGVPLDPGRARAPDAGTRDAGARASHADRSRGPPRAVAPG